MGSPLSRRFKIVAALGVLTASCVLPFTPASSATAHSVSLTKVSIPESATGGYVPSPPAGATDDYRCTFFDPKFTSDQIMTKAVYTAQNHAGKFEVHHAILYLVAKSQVSQYQNAGVKHAWSCFSPSGVAWLTSWAPGRNEDIAPTGYGMSIPAGSAFVLETHYNTLAGKARDNSYFTLSTIPNAGSGLTPLNYNLVLAPPDLPCPAGEKGALCDKSASLLDLAKRFGASAVGFTAGLEAQCSHSTAAYDPNWQTATSTSCISQISGTETIHRIAAHMHMLGKTFTFELCGADRSCTKSTKALFVASYSFDNQQAYTIPATTVNAGSYVKVTCSFDPLLRRFNPQTKNLPNRYITWGDGSSDEMCLAILGVSGGFS